MKLLFNVLSRMCINYCVLMKGDKKYGEHIVASLGDNIYAGATKCDVTRVHMFADDCAMYAMRTRVVGNLKKMGHVLLILTKSM